MNSELLQHGLVYGVILTVVMVITFLALLWVNPEIWLDDYPPDVRARFGEMSDKAKKQKRVAGVLVLTFFFGIVIVAAVRWTQTHSGEVNFADLFWSSFLIFNFFNLVDLLVLDWLVFVTIQPKIAILPGTEGAAGYKDYAFHFYASLKGVVMSLVVSGLVALGVWLFM